MTRGAHTQLDAEMTRQGRMNKWLAGEIGVNVSEISRWRHGVHLPSQITREKIAGALGTNVSELFPDSGASSLTDEAA